MKSDDYPSHDDSLGGSSGGIDWQELYHAVRKRLWIVILCLTLGGIGSAAFMASQHQAFQARSVLFIQQEQSRVLEKVQGVREDQILSLDMINTVVDLLRSYPFAERVAARLKLQKDPRFLRGLAVHSTEDLTSEAAAGWLVPHVAAAYRPKTRLIDIFITLPDAALTTEVANAYAEEYLRYGFDRRAEANKAANQFLLDEAAQLRKQMVFSEEKMQSFREQERSASLESMQHASEGKLAEYSRNISELETKLFQLDTDLKAASVTPGDTDALMRLPSVSQQPKVLEINQAIADIERQFTLLKQRYRARHPTYIAAQTQLSSLQHSRSQVLQDMVNLLKGEHERLQAQYDELKSENKAQETQLLTVTGKSVKYNDLKRDLETNQAMYNSILARLAEIDVTKGMTDSQVQIHEHALGAVPVSTSLPKVYALGILLGLITGLGLALGIHFLDHSVKTVDQAERLSGLVALAAIPKKARRDGRRLDVVSEREGVVAESFRSLRTSLAMVTHADDRRIFLFTSAVPSEGKTFCSSNFAATLGQQGFRTLLIDADLRRPMISRLFFGENHQPGLADVLSDQAELSAAVHASSVENLDILPAGTRAPNPAELLATPRLREILHEALGTYHRIVIDTAPVLAVSDSLLIAPYADVSCLVLRSFKTPRKTFVRALKALEEINARPAGIVINFLPTGTGNHYYYSGKYHGVYGEKGVYGT